MGTQAAHDLKISFCTTCRGEDYLERLKKTLPENLKRNTGTGHHNNVEFVIVAYGDENVTKWLKDNYADEIKSGLIRAVDLPRKQAEFFKMAHAKNIAHRMATGDVLCNLDCDNITGENFSGWLNEKFSENPDIVVRPSTRDKLLRKLTTGATPEGAGGRIAISKQHFDQLHGYNENNNAAKDGDDTDLQERAIASGLRAISISPSQFGETLNHSNADRCAHMSPEDREKSLANFNQNWGFAERVGTVKRIVLGEGLASSSTVSGANPNGAYGCAHVAVLDGNLNPTFCSLEPAPHSGWLPLHKKLRHQMHPSADHGIS